MNQSLNDKVQIDKALKLHQEGNIPLAKEIYQSILESNPNNDFVLSLMGTVLIQENKPKEAINYFTKSLSLDQNQPLALCNLAVSEHQLKRYESSLNHFNAAIQLQPNYAEAFNYRGKTLLKLGKKELAIKSYNQAIKINPTLLDAYINRGDLYRDQDNVEEAIDEYEKILKINPNYADALTKAGELFLEYSIFNKAISNFEKLLALNPKNKSALFYCAISHQKNNHLEKAKQLYDQLINEDSENLDALNNRAFILQSMGNYNEALNEYKKILQRNKHHANALLNTGIIKLTLGKLEEGWKLYEFRWAGELKKFQKYLNKPLWLGNESLKGKIILIHLEQGFGDAIQFCRYFKMLEALGARIIVELPVPLIPLISSMQCNLQIIEKGKKLASFDFHCPIMSLPLAFKTTLETIPAITPYLYVNNEKKLDWKHKLQEFQRKKIGLAFSGSATHPNDVNRSIPLHQFKSILDLPFDFFILQKDIRGGDKKTLDLFPNIHNYQNELDDFSDTAALIQAMDLVISIDTSVIHLAGALRKETWVLIPQNPDFRWMLDRTDSPWYPKMKLFRQKEIGKWNFVIDNILKSLKNTFNYN
jgi:tetratricopeptide (TPR) repeat protein